MKAEGHVQVVMTRRLLGLDSLRMRAQSRAGAFES